MNEKNLKKIRKYEMFSLSLSILEIKISYDKIFQKQPNPFGIRTNFD
jgi:hypothetical protein